MLWLLFYISVQDMSQNVNLLWQYSHLGSLIPNMPLQREILAAKPWSWVICSHSHNTSLVFLKPSTLNCDYFFNLYALVCHNVIQAGLRQLRGAVPQKVDSIDVLSRHFLALPLVLQIPWQSTCWETRISMVAVFWKGRVGVVAKADKSRGLLW